MKALALVRPAGQVAALDEDEREDLGQRVSAAMQTAARVSLRPLTVQDLAAAAVDVLATEVAAANARADATRGMANEANAVLRAKLLSALGVHDDDTRSLASYVDALAGQRDRLFSDLDRTRAELDTEVGSREQADEMCDRLAGGIARLTGADIGEHSSENDPWRNALDAAATHASTALAIVAVVAQAREWRARHADLHYGDTTAITWPPSQALAAAVDRLNEATAAGEGTAS